MQAPAATPPDTTEMPVKEPVVQATPDPGPMMQYDTAEADTTDPADVVTLDPLSDDSEMTSLMEVEGEGLLLPKRLSPQGQRFTSGLT